jgi:hypothetical protein
MGRWIVSDQPVEALAPGGQLNVRSMENFDQGWVDHAKIYLSSKAAIDGWTRIVPNTVLSRSFFDPLAGQKFTRHTVKTLLRIVSLRHT